MVSAMNYRTDIDGLRAVAVIPVILYHAGVSWLGGGYVGVDVFFVISGFLITSMIAAEARSETFSIVRFYERRIRRIFPAYFVMTASVMALAWFVVTPFDFARLGQSVVAASCFGSNVLFWLQDGYFDAPAHMKPMLHTWSLSVEEQFYVAFPLFLIALFRWQRSRLRSWIFVCLAGSLAGCIWMTIRDASTAFYQAPLRGWELLLGSVLALELVPPIRNRTAREIIAACGLAAIAFAVVRYSSATAFPGYHALLPCLGATFVIHAARDTVVGRALAFAPIVFVGRISYSLYLWHWPLIVLAGYWVAGPLPATILVGVIGTTIVLSTLSWRYIEQPFRERRIAADRRWLFGGAAVATIFAIGTGGFIWRSGGVPQRVSAEVIAFDGARKDFNKDRSRCHAQDERPIRFDDKCIYGRPGVAPELVIWGDSFAPELALVLGREAEAQGRALIYMSYSNCPPAVGLFADTRPACDRHNAEMLSRIATSPSIRKVILVARYEVFVGKFGAAFFPTFERVVRGLADAEKEVIVIYPIPRPPTHVPTMLARYAHMGRSLSEAAIDRVAYERDNRETIAFLDRLTKLPRVRGIKPTDRLCDDRRCAVVAGGRALYYDDAHLSVSGAALVVSLLRDVISM